jgi:hypothetical protein
MSVNIFIVYLLSILNLHGPFFIGPTTCMTMPQWVEMWRVYQNKEIRGIYKRSEDDVDDGLLRMRSLTIWEAQETMEGWVNERDNRSICHA